ncbi:MAG: D-alanyl-D-alanine endopeptidase [Betaproteobacteria bacterium]|nr:D-alanyl-D-alanine endopeptidase [Betaproteobacteria bacterium]
MPLREDSLKTLCSAIVLGLALLPGAYAHNPLAASAVAARAGALSLKSAAALVVEQGGDRVFYAKNVGTVVPIASITKLMTALVVLEAGLPLAEPVTISEADVDGIKRTRSRLRVGTTLARGDLLKLALMASENRAAAALTRAYPGGAQAFVAAMNQKAIELGMWRTRFVDGTGLSSDNVSTAQDLARLVNAAHHHPLIREFTTDSAHAVALPNGRLLRFTNSNRLVKNASWDIGLSKTGYISEAGRCLVLQARISSTPVIIVLLDSWGKLSRVGDANRIKKWIEGHFARQPAG